MFKGRVRDGERRGQSKLGGNEHGRMGSRGDKKVQLCVSRLLIRVLFWLSPVSALQPGLASY